MIDSIEIFCCTENPELSMVKMALLLDSKFSEIADPKLMYQTFIKEKVDVLKIIHFTFKLNEEGSGNFLSLDLLTLMDNLGKREDKHLCNLLFQSASSELPNFMAELGKEYGYNSIITGDRSNIQSSGISDRNSNVPHRGFMELDRESSIVKLINDHWKYVNEVILTSTDGDESNFSIGALEFQYKSAFRHGLKHMNEDWLNSINTSKGQ